MQPRGRSLMDNTTGRRTLFRSIDAIDTGPSHTQMLWLISPFLKINYKPYWVIPLRKCSGTHSWGGIENRSVLPHRHGPRSGIANVGSPFENARLPAGTTIVKPKPILEPTKPPPSLRLQVPQTSTRQPDSQTARHPATQNPKQSKVTLHIRTK